MLFGVVFGFSFFLVIIGIYQVATYRTRKLDRVILHDSTYRNQLYKSKDATQSIFISLAHRLQGLSSLFLNEKRKRTLEQKLDQASVAITPEELVGEQLAGALIGAIFGCIGFFAGKVGILTLLFFTMFGWLKPQMALDRKWRQRRKQISDQLLSFVDIYALMIDTGASLYSGLEKAGRAVGKSLGEEIAGMLKQSQSRGLMDALRQFSERIQHPDIDGFVTILHQASKYGAGMDVVNSLRQFSYALRSNRQNEIEKNVQKIGVKILFPMYFFILLPMMAILFAPVIASFGASGL